MNIILKSAKIQEAANHRPGILLFFLLLKHRTILPRLLETQHGMVSDRGRKLI